MNFVSPQQHPARPRQLLHLCAGLLIGVSICATPAYGQTWRMQPVAIATRWAKDVDPARVLPDYPRPQMVRSRWVNLNGLWDYAIAGNDSTEGAPVKYDGTILVPYPLESALSGVQKQISPTQRLWYHRQVAPPVLRDGERLLLHFGAVDWETTVWVNGKDVCRHRGGYTAFSCDITGAVHGTSGESSIAVRVADPTDHGPNPHGKQTLAPGGIMYTPTTGIWQTVWLETVPSVSIGTLTLTPDIDRSTLQLRTMVRGDTTGYTVDARAMRGTTVVGTVRGAANAILTLAVPQAHLWSPDDPFLYDLSVRLLHNGTVVDSVTSYFGMRKIEVKKDAAGVERIYLNNRYTYNLGTLDQGFWPEGLYTAPTDAALVFDVKAIKAMGFNTIRKHIKVEPARWYYHCDRLGMMVWQDLVNPGGGNAGARTEFESESQEIMTQLHNYPSVTTWVVFNEGWGAYDQGRVTKWVKSLDSTRMVNGHSGENLFQASPADVTLKWENSDLTDTHVYPGPGIPPRLPGKAQVLGEFGGIGTSIRGHLWHDDGEGWGYGGTVPPNVMRTQYGAMVDALVDLQKQGLSGSIYTQPFDVESEQNGLMTYDRAIVKVPFPVLRQIHARLWPITKNWAATTQGVSASVADSIDGEYAALRTAFRRGQRDTVALKTLTVRAEALFDSTTAAATAAAYIRQVANPWTEPAMQLLMQHTYRMRDPGFAFIQQHLDTIIVLLGRREVSARFQTMVFADLIRPLLTTRPDWNRVDAVVDQYTRKYPNIDGEVMRTATIQYYLQKSSTGCAPLVDAVKRYDAKFSSGDYVAWARGAFARCTDTVALKSALEWASKAVDRNPSSAMALDTYANLLYKLGRAEEAMESEKKATRIDPENADFRSALDAMQRGKPTWPTT